MSNIPRYLITNADERTWKFDQPVVFLGEWCKHYNRKHIWQKLDAVVAAPYGLAKVQKDEDFYCKKEIKTLLFPILCQILNEYHNIRRSERFWNIVLGHWFDIYTDVIINRTKTLEQCFKNYKISGFTTIRNANSNLAVSTLEKVYDCLENNLWNSMLDMRILEILELNNIPTAEIFETLFFEQKINPPKLLFKNKVKRMLIKLTTFFSRDSDAFFITTYLPRKKEILLQIILGQIPVLRTENFYEILETPDSTLRNNLANKLESMTPDSNYRIHVSLLFELLPTCYLEGFSSVNDLTEKQSWPKKPKFIFTSNSFATDEVFKHWAANKVELGTEYIVGQHGGNYGTSLYLVNHSVEEVTSNKFLTWGWKDGLPQHTPALFLKSKHIKKDFQDKLLLIELPLEHRKYSWDVFARHTLYFDAQKEFVANINDNAKTNLVVRLHAQEKAYTDFYTKIRWEEFDSSLYLDQGEIPLSELIATSKLLIVSYDSTVLLEALTSNIPVLAFFNDIFDNLRESSKPFYQVLVDSGILYSSPLEAAKKVNEIWDNVEDWWAKSGVQSAREVFCEKYAMNSKSTVLELKKCLRN